LGDHRQQLGSSVTLVGKEKKKGESKKTLARPIPNQGETLLL
jgi:hypothetical protein